MPRVNASIPPGRSPGRRAHGGPGTTDAPECLQAESGGVDENGVLSDGAPTRAWMRA